MKRLLALLALALCSCSDIFVGEEMARPTNENLPDLTAAFAEEGDTRTYIEDGKYLRWHEGDMITAFFGNTLNRQYRFNGATGDNSGTFSLVTDGVLGTGNSLDRIYAIYPYSAEATIADNGAISLTIPAVQTYAENSFGVGANLMAAVTENVGDTFLSFKNICGYLKLKLYNADGATLTSLEVKGNNGEQLAGNATLTINYGEDPTLLLADSATRTITLDCGEGVALGTTAETATELWVVVPATTFTNGLTITATDSEGKVYEKSTTKEVVIERNVIQPMAALNAEFAMLALESWKIYYTATAKVEPYNKSVFGANYVSNEWDSTTKEGVITFDGEVTTIGKEAFMSRYKLTSITIPECATTIGSKAFYGCTNLKTIAIPDCVTTISSDAFNQCGITSITIPEGVTTIATNLFSNCDKLASVTLSDNITSIGNTAFNGCTSLTHITIPGSVTTIGNRAFTGCYNLKTIYCDATTPPTLATSVFPTAVENIYVPTTSINAYKEAWSAYASLITTTTPVGNEIWYTNGSTTTATEPDHTDVFGANIVSNTYDSAKKRWVITFDGNISAIGDYAFSYCKDLISITIPEGVTSIGESAFSNCWGLTDVTIPSSVTSIGDYAFQLCDRLASINIPEGVTSIGVMAFYATGLRDITIPSSVTSIGFTAFYYCVNLVSITVTDGNPKYDSREGCNAIIETETNCLVVGCCASTIPNDVVSIRDMAFAECKHLHNITIPDSVKSIGYNAFCYCPNLTTVYIGSGVVNIESSAFYGCGNLQEVYCYAVNPPTLGYDVFDGSGYVIRFYVPAASVDAYKAQWSKYDSQIRPL